MVRKYELVEMALPIISLLYALGVFATCLVIDLVRSLLFKLINQRKWYLAYLSKMDKKVFVYYDFVFKTISDNIKFV